MANIRLKTITVESLRDLVIQNGNVIVNNTGISNSMLSGSLISNGGIGINTTFNSTSSTSGGSFTVGGGAGIMRDLFIGGDLNLDTSTSVFRVDGLSEKRLFLDNTQFYLSPDGVNKRFHIKDSRVSINITATSVNASTGALLINGGISISCSESSQNAYNGGALTVAGGVSVGENINVAKSINTGSLNINYIGFDQLTLSNSSESSYSSLNMSGDDLYVINSDGDIYINDHSAFYRNKVDISCPTSISDTTASINGTTGSFVVSGGLSISNTTDATSASSGGSLTTLGGIAVNKNIIVGDSILIDKQNTNKSNKLILYESNGIVSSIGNRNGNSLVYKVSDTSGNHIFYANESNEVFRINGTNEVVFIGKDQRYSIVGGGKNDNSLSFKSSERDSSIGFFTNLGNNTQNNDICIYNLGQLGNVDTSEYLKIGWDNNNNKYVFSSQISGSGNFHNISLESGIDNQIMLRPDGSTHLYSDIVSSDSNTAALVLKYGGLSINCTRDSINSQNGGGLTIAGGAAITKNLIVGTGISIDGSPLLTKNTNSTYSSLQLSNNENKYTGFKMVSDTGNSISYPFDFSLYSLGVDNLDDNFECFKIEHTNTNGNYIITTNNKGAGNKKGLVFTSTEHNIVQLTVCTSGNVGINMSTPLYNFDINGTLHTNDIVYFSNTEQSTCCSIGSFVIDGGMSISNTNPAISSTNGGALSVAGGIGIGSNMIVEGIVQFLHTQPSTSYFEGSVIMNGGLSIGSGQNANSIDNGGGLTVLGGGSFSGDLYIGGSINGSGSSSSTYAYITLTATDSAINLSTGSFITFGGIVLQSDSNSVSISNGGAILTPGGASIGKDVYIGGTNYIYGMSNYYGNSKSIETLINFYDNFSVKRFSLDKAKVSHDFSITRYNSLGSPIEKSIVINNNDGTITFNNNLQSTSSESASILLNGGLSVNCTSGAVSVSGGGGLTVAGGASISKNVFIGGDIVFSSTSSSNDTSTGALLVAGGVGISGNLNILGNTLINGNLTVKGTTTSIDTTNAVIKDNVLVLNSGPSGSTDSGFVIQRYQKDNNNGLGDVINDSTQVFGSLPDQSGMTSTQIKLDVSANPLHNFYNGHWIKIISGFSSNQVRHITSYNGTTKIASISSPWSSQNPSIGDSISIYNKPYVGLIFNETTNIFEFGSTSLDPTQNISFTDYLPILFSDAKNVSTQPSTNSSSASFVMSGGISIFNSTDATSVTSGGTFTSLGGASISKKLFVGEKLYVNGANMTPNPYDMFSTLIFYAQNNQSVFTDITRLVFDSSVWSFDIYFSVRILVTSGNNMYSNFHIRGVNKISTWEIIKTYVGDDTGIQFSITDFGQIQYTTPDFSNIDSITFKWRALVN